MQRKIVLFLAALAMCVFTLAICISASDVSSDYTKAGIAKEFMSCGEITYSSITWTEGQTVDQIVGLN